MTWIPSFLLLVCSNTSPNTHAPCCWYVVTHPQIHILRGNCLVTGWQVFLRNEVGLTFRREVAPSTHVALLAALQGSITGHHESTEVQLCQLPVHPLPPCDHLSWFPALTTALVFFCQAHPWVATTVLASPPAISLAPPFLSIPTAPRPLLLQAWIIIIAS